MPLRRAEPVDFGASAETDDAREVEADFFPPEHKITVALNTSCHICTNRTLTQILKLLNFV